MRALVQRVSQASLSVHQSVVARIGQGLLVLIGIRNGDDEEAAHVLARKVVNLRIFEDEDGKMNLCVRDISGGILVVSQFTLYGETRKGNRPSFSQAASAEAARPLYERFIEFCRREHADVQTGVFQAHMEVTSTNYGPVTLLCTTDT
jgi:D-tyrosyl-tRNA(Tyr) deacylase